MNKTIVCVDDSGTVRTFVKKALESAGYTNLYFADNGLDGIGVVWRIVPALLISDVEMPEMNGYDMVSMVRAGSRTARVKTLLLTSKEMTSEDVFFLKRIGVDAFVAKPFEYNAFISKVNALIEAYNAEPE